MISSIFFEWVIYHQKHDRVKTLNMHLFILEWVFKKHDALESIQHLKNFIEYKHKQNT